MPFSLSYEVVAAIVATTKIEFSIISDRYEFKSKHLHATLFICFRLFFYSEDLVNILKGRTLDKKFKVRKEALTGLAMIYQMSRDDPNVSETTKKAFAWIPNAILHGYYVAGIKDRLLVERLFTTLFPSVKSAEISMKKLYHLFATVDEKAIKALIEIVKIQAAIGKALSNLAAAPKKEIAPCVAHLSKYLPYPTKEAKQILKFADDLAKDDLKKLLKNYLDLEKSCVERMDAANQLSRKPEMINQTNAVKLLMKRMSSLFIDKKAVQYLVSILFLRLLILSFELGFYLFVICFIIMLFSRWNT